MTSDIDTMHSGSAVWMPNWLGDFLIALSVVARKAAATGGGAVTMIVPAPLMPLCGLLSAVPALAFDRSSMGAALRSIAKIRRRRFERSLVLPHSFSSALFAALCGIPRRRGIRRNNRQWLLTDVLPRSTRTSKLHITREYAEVLETPWAPPESWDSVRIAGDDRGAGAIVLCPGAHYGPAKRWPQFVDLARMLPGRIVLLGTKNEAPDAARVAAADPARIADLCGATSVVEAARIIAAARAVVANDSGLMHLAGFLGTPVVGIFGSTRPSWTSPLGRNSRIVHQEMPCSPCFEHTCRYGHYECLHRISTDMVLQALDGLSAAAGKRAL